MHPTLIVALTALVAHSTSAQTPVPADTRNNALIIAIENTSSWHTAESLTVSVLRHPPAVTFHQTMVQAGKLHRGDSLEVALRFDVSRDAPLSGRDTVEIEIAHPRASLWRRTLVWTFTGPTVFALDQNYPNPFNPTTRIGYALPVPARVDLGVFDLLGRRVAVLADGDMEAGFHNADLDGASLAAGVYFIRLSASAHDGRSVWRQTRKAMLLK